MLQRAPEDFFRRIRCWAGGWPPPFAGRAFRDAKAMVQPSPKLRHKPCELKKWWNNWNSFLDIGRRLHGECFWVSRLPESWCQPSKLDEKSQQPQILLMPQNGWIADKMFSATGTFYPRHHVNFRTWFCCGNVMPFRFFFTVWRARAEFNIGHATDMTTVIDAKQSVDDGLQNGVDGFWTLRCLFLFCEIAEITGATRATKNWT